MERILEKSRYLILFAVIGSLVASAAAFVWGAYKTALVLYQMFFTKAEDGIVTVSLVELMDKFLIAVGLYIFAIGMYELFFRPLNLAPWLVVHNLHEIKARLSSIIVLVMAILFVEQLVAWRDPQGTMYFAISIGVVAAALIAFNALGERDA
jgi:uncharacterized membrane protein YqhA